MAYKPFFMLKENAKLEYQKAFFMAVTDFAIYSAKGYSPEIAWPKAIVNACSIFQLPLDHAGLVDLVSIFHDNGQVPVEFFKGGQKINAVVRWSTYSEHMEVV